MTKNSLYYFAALLLFAVAAYIYGYKLVNSHLNIYNDDEQFAGIANFHDHFEYKKIALNNIIFNETNISTLNVMGISFLYATINKMLDIQKSSTPFLINICAFFVSGILHKKICDFLKFPKRAYFLFYLNLPMIYYSQLIGKDLLTTALLYSLLFAHLTNRLFLIPVISVLGMLVRIQFGLYAIFLLIFKIVKWENHKFSFFCVYLASSLIGAYSLSFSGAIGDHSELDFGITSLAHHINNILPVGNLLLNPIRLVQNFVLLISSPLLGLICNNYYLIMMTPLVFYILYNIKIISPCFYIKNSKLNQFSFICIMVLLANPIVNTRYVAQIAPFFVLSLYSAKILKYHKLKFL